MRKLLPLVLPLIAAGLFYATGLTQTLGAHPFWAQKVIWIGVGLGVPLGAILWGLGLRKPARLIGVAVLTLAAFATAYVGKSRFAASYAEDTIAGYMWYFGWMATCVLVFALISSAVWATRKTN